MRSNVTRRNIHRVFLVISLVSFLFGLTGLGTPALSGLGKAVGAIFFILFFIFNLLKDELTDSELAAEKRLLKSRKPAATERSRHLDSLEITEPSRAAIH